MIDFINFSVEYRGSDINGGYFMSVEQGGDIEFTTERFLNVKGSWDASVKVRAFAGKIQVRGNVVKFLQGHNLFGSNDLHMIIRSFVQVLHTRLIDSGFTFDLDFTMQRIDHGIFDLTRLDLTESFALGSRTDALSWLMAVRSYLQKTRQKVEVYENGIYIGKGSSYLTVTIYYKGDEIRKHPFMLDDPNLVKSLRAWANDKIRIEISCRRLFLQQNIFCHQPVKAKNVVLNCRKKKLKYGFAWNEDLVMNVYNYLLKDKIRLPKDTGVVRCDMNKLPGAVRGSFYMHQQGFDMKEILNKATFYRHRSRILELTGVDIARPVVKNDTRNVVPLIRTIEAKPAEIPQWAFDYGLVVNS